MDQKIITADKFSKIAQGWTESRYDDPIKCMERRSHFVWHWGTLLQQGDRVLELGCGDGSLSCFLAKQGLQVVGIDIAPGMIEEAKRRTAEEEVAVQLLVSDAEKFQCEESFDVVISFMGAFFWYVDRPAEVLAKLLPYVRKKVILDWNFRSPFSAVEAIKIVQDVGFIQVEARPFLYPNRHMSKPHLKFRLWLEDRLNVSMMSFLLKHRHFGVLIKGEVRSRSGI